MTEQKMPVLFLGHGSPMTVLTQNRFTTAWQELGTTLKDKYTIDAVVSISAHWLTPNVRLTGAHKPKTIHDFYGFPDELFQLQYPCPGHPELAAEISDTLADNYSSSVDEDWGLDHGSWAVLYHLFPDADVPVVQLSLNHNLSLPEMFELGRSLRELRNRNILFMGSGNIVHNLSKIQFGNMDLKLPQAVAFDDWFTERMLAGDFEALQYPTNHEHGEWSLTSGEHYWPAVIILGMMQDSESIQFLTPDVVYGSISMRGFTAGL